jgi:hypothetical protein
VVIIAIEAWPSPDSTIDSFIEETGITFPIAQQGYRTIAAYDVVANSIVVVDQDGIVQFVDGVGTEFEYARVTGMLDDAAQTVADLVTGAGVARRVLPRITDPDRQQPGVTTLTGRQIGNSRHSASQVVARYLGTAFSARLRRQ